MTVAVITPTWQRRTLLEKRCIPSVDRQTFEDWRHIVVNDGADMAISDLDLEAWSDPRRTLLQLPEHPTIEHWGVIPRLHGLTAVDDRCQYIAYLDDDNAWRPGHLGLLVAALDRIGADFAFSRARVQPGCQWEVGAAPPIYGTIDTSLIVHRRGLLDVATWEVAGYAADWDLVRRWLEAGATYTFVPVITVDYWLAAA